MTNSKLILPTNLRGAGSTGASAGDAVSAALQTEAHKTRRTELESFAKVETARLNVAMQALDVVKAGLNVLQSYNTLQATRAEWRGRVEVADRELAIALAALETARVKNAPLVAELEQSRESQKRVLALFDALMEAAQDAQVSREDKQKITGQLLDLSGKLVELRS